MNPNTIDAGGMQPRRVGSIIPAVPRMFERRLGQAKVPRDVRSTASNAVIPEKMVEVSLEKSVCHKPQDLHIEVSGQSEKEDSEQQEIETSPRQEGLRAGPFSGEGKCPSFIVPPLKQQGIANG